MDTKTDGETNGQAQTDKLKDEWVKTNKTRDRQPNRQTDGLKARQVEECKDEDKQKQTISRWTADG